MLITNNASLLPFNTFGIDARAKQVVEYDTVDELRNFLSTGSVQHPILHVGQGSNLLFLQDFAGTILHSRIRDIQIIGEDDEHVRLRVGSGVIWDDLVAYTIQQGWSGLENLSLIPGEVGSAAVQNIGAYGAEAKDYIRSVECLDVKVLDIQRMDVSECGYGYRSSVFKSTLRGRYIITHVVVEVNRCFCPRLDYGGIRRALQEAGIDDAELTPSLLRKTIIAIRQAKLPDPKVQGNAGSFFMNPVVERPLFEAIRARYPQMPYYEVDEQHVKIPAGWMIEQCGWKGRCLGAAGVHDKQALVLVNLGGATGQDIVRLSDAIRADVKREFGIDIHPEVNFI